MPDTLLQRIAAGDPQAVEECLQQYSGLVWSLARRFAPRYADAQDAVQEIFLDVWRSASRFDPQAASETTFIATIAKRRLIDRHRRRTRDIGGIPLDEATLPASAELPDRVERDDEAARVRLSLRRLSTDERHVLELAYIEGLSQRQIAEATHLPLGTVKTHARRGLMRLREMLGVTSA